MSVSPRKRPADARPAKPTLLNKRSHVGRPQWTAGRLPTLQSQLEKQHSASKLFRQRETRFDLVEAEASIEILCFHLPDSRIKPHPLMARGSCLANERVCQGAPNASALKIDIDKHALHLTGVSAEIMQGCTTGWLAIVECKEEPRCPVRSQRASPHTHQQAMEEVLVPTRIIS